MKFANLLTKFYFDVWAIRPDKHVAMGKLLHDYLRERMASGDVVGPQWADGEPVVPQMEIRNGVALIPVVGVLGKHLSFLELWCGGCDYDHIGQMIDKASADYSVHTMVFNINSPGGMIIGLREVVGKLESVRDGVTTIAYSDMDCCSAAYYLAAACAEIYFSPSSQVGNIGTFIAAVDSSRSWEMEGFKLELFKSGSLKAIGISGKEFTDAEREYLQSRVDKSGAQFRSYVSGRRGSVAAETMQGQWFDGDEAEELGLSDRVVSSLEEVLAAAMVANR